MAADSAVQAALPGIRNVCQRPYDGKIRENVKVYSEHFSKTGEKEEDFDYETRTEKTVELAQSYYTLVTDFYEYGYGASFHFGPVLDGHRVADCVLAYEKEIAQTLDAKPGKQILDIGCGVGGPARAIAKTSGATVTGLNICHYQVNRARELTKLAKLESRVSFKQGNFCKMDFPDNTFDGMYALESTCYAKKPIDVYKEVYRVLKPGATFVDSAWAMTDIYDSSNPEHVKIKGDIEYGSGIHKLSTIKEILEGLKESGLELVGFRNCHHEGDRPWYIFLTNQGMCSLRDFYASTIGRLTTHFLVNTLETLRILPKGSSKVHSVLLVCGDALIEGGKTDIFTPMFRIVARKPLSS